jgi:hypothetical protein
LKSPTGAGTKIDLQLLTASSVMFDAVHVPGGEKKKVRRMNLKELWTLIVKITRSN